MENKRTGSNVPESSLEIILPERSERTTPSLFLSSPRTFVSFHEKSAASQVVSPAFFFLSFTIADRSSGFPRAGGRTSPPMDRRRKKQSKNERDKARTFASRARERLGCSTQIFPRLGPS